MKHCPNLDCPYRRRHRRPQEYVDSAEACSDCGMPLALGDAPEPEAPASGAPVAAHVLKRLTVTAAALIAAMAAGHVGLPGIDTSSRLLQGHDRSDALSVVALGLTPFVSASVIVEFACVVVPRWRALRTDGFAGRAKIWRTVLALALLLAMVQALGVSWYLRSLDLMVQPGSFFGHALTVATLTAGAFGLLALTCAVDRFGLGNGFSVLLAGSIAGDLAHTATYLANGIQRGDVAPMQALLVAGSVLVVVVVTARTSRLVSATPRPTATFRIPASGAAPLTDAAMLLGLVASLRNLALPGLDRVATALQIGSTEYVATEAVVAVVLVVVFSYLFHLPGRVAELLTRLRGEGSSLERERSQVERLLRRAVPRSVLYVLVLLVCELVAWSTARAGASVGMVGVAILTAVVLDLLAESRARRESDDLVAIWPEHRVYAADIAVEALEQAEIPVFVRGLHHRVLLQFFGPFVPMHLLVARDKAEQAEAVVREMVGPAP